MAYRPDHEGDEHIRFRRAVDVILERGEFTVEEARIIEACPGCRNMVDVVADAVAEDRARQAKDAELGRPVDPTRVLVFKNEQFMPPPGDDSCVDLRTKPDGQA